MKSSAFAALFLASAGCLCVKAQTVDLKANIPFEFRMGAAVMPAGEYSVHYSRSVLSLRGETRNPKSAMVLAHTTSGGVQGPASTLVFKRYGDNYFLAKVRDVHSGTEQSLIPSAAEKELIARIGSVQTASVKLQPK